MADSQIASSSDWRKVRRQYRTARFNPQITIRRNGNIAISSDFARMANIADCTRATLFISEDNLRLAIQFHSDERDDDAFMLRRDGGSNIKKLGMSRVIVANTLLAQSPTITALVHEDASVRRYEPQKIDGKWVLFLAPCFEHTLSQSDEISIGSSGIYRYRSGIETIYIGRGNLRERLASAERRDWDYDRVEYSILNDDAVERRWESFWLDEYRQRNNRWPLHNRVAAVKTG